MTTSKPGLTLFPGISLAGSSRSWPGGVRRKGGKNVVWALVRNSGTSRVVAPPEMVGTGVRRGRKPKARVPDAAHWGGLGRSSDEGAVMALERRPRTSLERLANLGTQTRLLWNRRGTTPDESPGSRPVSREPGRAVLLRHPPLP